jgi:hypothetical protein
MFNFNKSQHKAENNLSIFCHVKMFTDGCRVEKVDRHQKVTLCLFDTAILTIVHTLGSIPTKFEQTFTVPCVPRRSTHPSTDGIAECDCHGIGILEIKCPFKHREVYPLKAAEQDYYLAL